MFIYTSPKGGSAMVESLPLARIVNGVKKFKVVWSGGGAWYATKDELAGRLVNEDNIPVVAHAEFQADLEEILATENIANDIIDASGRQKPQADATIE